MRRLRVERERERETSRVERYSSACVTNRATAESGVLPTEYLELRTHFNSPRNPLAKSSVPCHTMPLVVGEPTTGNDSTAVALFYLQR